MFEKLVTPQSENDISEHWIYTDQIYVSIVCTTFNQEQYIKEAIESFLVQETEYRFEIIIQDDVSTDMTKEIINSYKEKFPKIIQIVTPDENLYSKYPCKIWENLVPKISGKYISLCEGDDYWIDKFKIQKQVSIFESSLNNNISLVYSDSYRLKQTEQIVYYKEGSVKNNLDTKALILTDGIMTLTTMFKYSDFSLFFEKYRNNFPKWIFADLPMWFHLSSVGKFYYLPDKVSVYRELDESASNSKVKSKIIKFNIGVVDVRLFFAEKFKVDLNCFCKFIFKNKLVLLKSKRIFFKMVFIFFKKIIRM